MIEGNVSFQSDVHPSLASFQAAPATAAGAGATSAVGPGTAGLRRDASAAASSSSGSLPHAPKAFRVVSCCPNQSHSHFGARVFPLLSVVLLMRTRPRS